MYPTCILRVSYVYPTCILRVSYVFGRKKFTKLGVFFEDGCFVFRRKGVGMGDSLEDADAVVR